MDITTVTVAGAGVLGSQIAYQTAYKGFTVRIWLRSESSIDRARKRVEQLRKTYEATLDAMKANPRAYCRGLADEHDLDDQQIDALKQRARDAAANISYTTDLAEAAENADLIIEAIAENPQQKKDFYAALAPHLAGETILVTNSSTLLPSTFAQDTGRPERYLALHFANEIWKYNTAEVMGHAGTDAAVYDRVVTFAEEIGMIPLQLKKEQPGYILNSMLVPFLTAAQALLANGVADFETIDKTWMLGTGAPVGPFRILDVVGLKTAYNIAIMNPAASNPESAPGKVAAMLKERIDAGKTGIAAGEGFYKY